MNGILQTIEWFDFEPIKSRGGRNFMGARQLQLSHSCRDKNRDNAGNWRVIFGKDITSEVLSLSKEFTFKFGRNVYTGECFIVFEAGAPKLGYSEKELKRSGRICYTSKPLFEAFCDMLGIDKATPCRLYFDLSQSLSNSNDLLTYKILKQ